MDEGIHGARLLGGDILVDLEPLDLTRDLAGKVRCIETGDPADAGTAGDEVRPGFAYGIAYGSDAPEASHNNATGHISFSAV